MSEGKQKKAKGITRRRDKVKTAYALEPQKQRQHDQRLDVTTDVNSAIYPSFKSHALAPWTKGEPEKDDRLRLKEEYMAKGEPYGKLMVSQEDLDYISRMKEKEEYVQYLKLAMAIPDPERPETQQLLRNVAPEIIDLPEKNHKQSVGFQKRLREILTNGIVEGPEDNKFMFQICRADTYLPVWPIWDPMGDLLDQIAEDKRMYTFKDFNQVQYLKNPDVSLRAKQRGIFNPVRWGVIKDIKIDGRGNDVTSKVIFSAFQLSIKKALFRKVYKGLKSMDENQLDDMFMKKPSVLTGKPTEESPFKLLDWAATRNPLQY